MASNPTYDFVLNGLDLTANTTRIQLHKRNMNSYNHVLRQSTPTGSRSGRSTFVISAEMAFPNTDEINNKLRHLIAHFRVSPFAQLISSYVSKAALSDETEEANLAVTLSNLSVYTSPDLPESLFANFDMTIFNYFPYSPDFAFKNELTGPRIDANNKYSKVASPVESNLYQKGFAEVLRGIPSIGVGDQDVTISYSSFVREAPPTSGQIPDKDISKIGKTLFSASSEDTRIIGGNSKMHRNATGTFQHLARLFNRKYRREMQVSNMFIPAGGIDFFTDETDDKVTMDEHMAGLAFDLSIHTIDETGIDGLKKKYRDDKDYKSFVEIARENSFVPNSSRPWHFSFKGELGKKSIEEIIRENHSISDTTRSKKNVLDNEDYIKIYNDFLTQKKSTGFLPTNARDVWKIEASETILKGNDALAVTSINVSLTHNITSIPIVGYEYPTTQYMGGKHAKAVFALEGLRRAQIDRIKVALNTAHNNENGFSRVRDHNVITITNPITRLFGLEHCIVDSTESSTVPGNPDMDIFVFGVTEYDPWFTEGFSQEDVKVSSEIKTKAFSLIRKYLKFGPMHKFIGQQQASGYGANKDSLVNTFMENIHSFYDPKTRTVGVVSDYGPHVKDYSPVVDSHINSVADILNDFVSDEDVHKGYVGATGNVYGLSRIINDLIGSKEPKIVSKRKEGAAGTGVASLDFVKDDSVNVAIPAKMYERLSSEFWSMFSNGVFQLNQFKSVDKEIAKLRKQSLTQCYRDLNLPTTVTNEPIDTNPDYYFWSEDNDTTYFDDVLNETKEFAKEGLSIAKAFETEKKDWVPADVWSGEPAKNGHKRPKEYGNSVETDYFKINEEFVKTHDFSLNGLEDMLDTLVEQARDEKIFTMNRAYPTYKVYFVEEDEGEEFHIIPRLSFDDFFGYNAVHDIKIIRSRKVPADLCILTMSNLDQKLTSSAKYNTDDTDKFYETRGSDKESFLENPIDALVLRPGQKIQVKLGYSNNPKELETVFNGQIVEVGGTHTVTIVCQSYATELVSHVKGIEEAEEIRKSSDKVTGALLANIMQSPEVVHFGTRKRKAITNIVLTGKEGIESAGNSLYGPNIDPRDDNIFPPSVELYLTDSSFFDPGGTSWDISVGGAIKGAWESITSIKTLLAGVASSVVPGVGVATVYGTAGAYGFMTGLVERYTNLDYKIFHTTIWDVFKEMELRHPGWIASPTVYGDRMSMFFGVPDMGHWSRPETLDEYQKNTPIRKEAPGQGTVATVLSENKHGVPFVSDIRNDQDRFFFGGIGQVDKDTINIRKSIVKHRFTPFRKHHYLADKINIVSNDIRVNADVYNAVTVQYVNDVKDIDEYGNVNYESGNTKTLKVDADIRDEHVNLLFSQQPNCEGEFMAARYAQGLLLRHLKDVYTGSITVLGNPKIKPYDVCHVFDDIADMRGPIEVEQVVHHFSHETGFITEIVPDLCVSGNQYATIPLVQAMGEINYLKGVAAAGLLLKGIGPGRKYGPTVIGKLVGAYKAPSGTFAKKAASAAQTAKMHSLYAKGKAVSAAESAYLNSMYAVDSLRDSASAFSKASKAAGLGTATLDAASSAKGVLKGSTSSLLNNVSNLKSKTGASLKLRGGFKGLLAVGAKRIGPAWITIGAMALYGLGSIYIKETQEHQPIFIKPLVVNKVPFVAGIEGFKQNTLYSAYMDRFGLAVDDIKSTWEDIKVALEQLVGAIAE